MGVRVNFGTAEGDDLASYPDTAQVPRVGEELRRSYRAGDTYRITHVQWTGNNVVHCIVEPIEET
jgi:hypothetical protein